MKVWKWRLMLTLWVLILGAIAQREYNIAK